MDSSCAVAGRKYMHELQRADIFPALLAGAVLRSSPLSAKLADTWVMSLSRIFAINGWPKNKMMKDIGEWNQLNILEGLEGFCLALLTRGLGWTKEEVDVFVARVSRDLRDRKIHAYFPMPVAFGRKPYNSEMAFL